MRAAGRRPQLRHGRDWPARPPARPLAALTRVWLDKELFAAGEKLLAADEEIFALLFAAAVAAVAAAAVAAAVAAAIAAAAIVPRQWRNGHGGNSGCGSGGGHGNVLGPGSRILRGM